MPIQQTLSEIKARADKATAGPWKIGKRTNRVDSETWPSSIADCLFTHSNSTSRWLPTGQESGQNAAFIAAARTDVPALVRALEKAIEQRDWALKKVGEVAPLTASIAMKDDNEELTAILTSGQKGVMG